MLETTITNRNRQEEEVLALSSIYNSKEFSYINDDIIQCYYNVFTVVKDDLLRLESIWDNSEIIKYDIGHLPPIRVYLQLPIGYPNKEAPNFYITCSWLSPWQISLICQKFDEIWSENKGQEVLFVWFEFLRHDILNFFKIKGTLDISFMCMSYYCITHYFKLISVLQCDVRAIYSVPFYDPIRFLIRYNMYQDMVELEYNYYLCNICLDEHCGKQCIRLEDCNHMYCRKCIQQYIALKIEENNVADIPCPSADCDFNIRFNKVQEFCPELFSRYEHLLLTQALNIMNDIAFCPRPSCQCPVIKNLNNTLAICSKCDYSFCTYCYKVYHGVAPCSMSLSDMIKLIEDYENGNADMKKQLQKKYGKKQIQIVVEDNLTKQYLKKNAKPCPNCSTMITKIDGCNKITCIYCKANFCWLCGVHITTKNAYDHFLSINAGCYKRLFD